MFTTGKCKSSYRRPRSLRVEPLEQRRLMAIWLADGNLHIDGSDFDDQAKVQEVGDFVVASEFHTHSDGYSDGYAVAYNADEIERIFFHGNDGNDLFENDTSIRCTAFGGEGRDTLYGSDAADWLFGDADNDYIEGRGGNDILLGNGLFSRAEPGNDTLYGGAGRDSLYGGPGDDILHGDSQNDLLYGEDGSDVLYGEDGRDTLHGGNNDDYLFGGFHNDTLYGGWGNDRLDGEGDSDHLYGEQEQDTLDGGGGNDDLYGGRGHDRLNGGSGSDHLYGDNGNDRLIGGYGSDYLDGGYGDDGLYGGSDSDRDDLEGGSGRGADRFLTRANDVMADRLSNDVEIQFKDDTSNWTDREVENVDQAFAELQERVGTTEILKDSTDDGPLRFYKTTGNRRHPEWVGWNDRDSGRHKIYIKEWNEGSDSANWRRRRTVIHEIGHNWDSLREHPDNDLWRDFKDLNRDSDGIEDFARKYGMDGGRKEDWCTMWEVALGYTGLDPNAQSQIFRDKLAIVDEFFDTFA